MTRSSHSSREETTIDRGTCLNQRPLRNDVRATLSGRDMREPLQHAPTQLLWDHINYNHDSTNSISLTTNMLDYQLLDHQDLMIESQPAPVNQASLIMISLLLMTLLLRCSRCKDQAGLRANHLQASSCGLRHSSAERL